MTNVVGRSTRDTQRSRRPVDFIFVLEIGRREISNGNGSPGRLSKRVVDGIRSSWIREVAGHWPSGPTSLSTAFALCAFRGVPVVGGLFIAFSLQFWNKFLNNVRFELVNKRGDGGLGYKGILEFLDKVAPVLGTILGECDAQGKLSAVDKILCTDFESVDDVDRRLDR